MVLAAIAGTYTPARAGGKQPRVFIKPPDRTILQPWQATDRIILKFAESTGVRLRHGELVSLHAAGLGRVKRIFARHGVQPADIRPLFDRPEQSLAAEREEGMARSGQELADLSLYYSIELLSQTDVAGLCDALNNLEIVEAAVPAQRDVPPPTDIAPVTPDLRAGQRYRSLTTGGIGVEELAGVPGIDGAGIAFADIEYG